MKTQSHIVPAENLRPALTQHWRDLCANGDLEITVPGGAVGGVTLAQGCLQWFARDSQGREVNPVERTRACGSQQLSFNWLRGQKPAFIRNFGPPPPPQRDGFLVEQPDHPLSIMRRPWLGVRFPDGRHVACFANGFPLLAQGHLLALFATFDDRAVTYPWLEQRLTFETVKLTLDLALALGESHALSFNPPCFGATQAHFHLHILTRELYPVERAVRISLDGGGAFPLYPAGCLILENASPDTLTAWLARFSERGISANLLIRNQTVFVFPRRPGVGVLPEFPAALLAFSELAGHWITSDEKVFDALDEDSLRTALRKSTLPADEAWPIASGKLQHHP